MAYWTYLTLGIIVSLIPLGILAINIAIDRNMALHIKGMDTLTEEQEALAQRVCPGAPYAVTNYYVKKYVVNSFYAECSYYDEFIDGRKVERVTVHIVTGELAVKGDWSTGYTVSYYGNKDIIVRIDSMTKRVLEIKIVRAPIETYNLSYNDDMQKILRFAMQDELARKFLESDDYYVRNIRYPGNGLFCNTDPCGSITIDKINSKLSFGIEANQVKGYPILVSTGFPIRAPFKIIISSDDPEPVPTFNVKEGQRLEIPLRIVGQTSSRNDTISVRLDATMTDIRGFPNNDLLTESSYGELFEYSFSTPEIKIQRASDLTVKLDLLVRPDLLASTCAQKAIYVLAIRGLYEDDDESLEDKYGGTIAYLNVNAVGTHGCR